MCVRGLRGVEGVLCCAVLCCAVCVDVVSVVWWWCVCVFFLIAPSLHQKVIFGFSYKKR